MDTLLKAAEQKLKQEPTAEVSNDGQNNLSYRLGMVAWGDSKSLSAYSICFLVVNSRSNPTPPACMHVGGENRSRSGERVNKYLQRLERQQL